MATDTIKHSIVTLEHSAPPSSTPSSKASPAAIAQAWCDLAQSAFTSKSADKLVQLFRPNDGTWRDILLTDPNDWNTLKTGEIKDHLSNFGFPSVSSLKVIKPDDAKYVPGADYLQAFLTFENDLFRGKGFLRLKETSQGAGDWKAFTFFTALDEIKGHEELAFQRRPLGAEHGLHEDDRNWLDRRREKNSFAHEDPTVLIVGGGQNALMLSARLTNLGISTLMVEKNPRLGDSWRNRYKSLCLHDPVWADHFPYISFPGTWPIYTPKDKLANWFEFYAEAMELNVWLESTIQQNPTYDAASKTWSVTILKKGAEPRVMKVSHLVMATGFSGEPRMPTFPMDEFKGTVTHSSGHKGAEGWQGKKAVVVGCCNSGHDIAADFYEHKVDTTIIQRSHTYVMSSKHGIPGLLNGTYEENGPPLADADVMLTSIPINLLEEYHTAATQDIAVKDKVILDGLTKVGFKLNDYKGGLFIKYFRDGGGYYIDVGASSLIADGKIKIKQGVEVEKLTKDGILFKDGVELKADVIVMATGYSSQRETVRRVISNDVANNIGPCWGADSQGEIPGVWRHSGVDRFYIQSGNMFQARCFSKHLAMYIHMQELGHASGELTSAYKRTDDKRF